MKNLLEYEDVLRSLVLKYNYGEWDEDMMQDAWVKATECYNKCVENNETDDDIIKAKIITWVKNYFINEIKKKKIETTQLNDEYDFLGYIDTALLLVELRNSLSAKDNEVLTLILQGKTVPEICEILGKSKTQIYRILTKIRGKIMS